MLTIALPLVVVFRNIPGLKQWLTNSRKNPSNGAGPSGATKRHYLSINQPGRKMAASFPQVEPPG